jgi:hypothetical protein
MLKEDKNVMVNIMLTKLMKISHGIRAGFLQNNLIVGRKIVRFPTLLRFVAAQFSLSSSLSTYYKIDRDKFHH